MAQVKRALIGFLSVFALAGLFFVGYLLTGAGHTLAAPEAPASAIQVVHLDGPCDGQWGQCDNLYGGAMAAQIEADLSGVVA